MKRRLWTMRVLRDWTRGGSKKPCASCVTSPGITIDTGAAVRVFIDGNRIVKH